MEYKNVLNHISNKVPLTEEEENIIASKLKLKHYLKGQYIIQEGDVNRHQVFVVSGKVRTFYLDQSGKEHIVAFGIENWWTGDICSFSTQTPAEFNTQCIDKTTVVRISYDDMEQLYSEVPKLERYFRIILQAAYGSMTKRIIRNHSMPAKERYVLFTETYPEIVQQVPQYMIASYLGITKEFLSNIRSQLSDTSKGKS